MPHVIPQKQDQLKVRISERAYRRMVGYAFRYANSSMNSKIWREVYGIIIGALDKQNNGIVNILDAIPMVVGERAGVNFEARQYVDMASIDASLFEKSTKQGLAQFLVGWWHTHPGFGFFFSQVDTMTHLGYLIANPNAMGLIFDHTQLTAFDCGLECLHLDDPTALMRAGHDFVIFELENYENLLMNTQAWTVRLQGNLKEAEKILTYIDGYLRRKLFAQLQRNFGILLVRKEISKAEKQEILGEDEETWIWDEKYLETMYRIPTFRRKLEHLLESAKNPRQKKAAAEKVRQFLEHPQEFLAEILRSFWERLNAIAKVYFYLDTRERQVIETFDQRLIEYWRILNGLLRKAGEILGQELGYRITRQRGSKPEVRASEEPSKEVPLLESSEKADQIPELRGSQGETMPQILPAKPAVKIPQKIIVPLKEKTEATVPASVGVNIKPPKIASEITRVASSEMPTQQDAQKTWIFNIVVEIIRREKKVSVSHIADSLKVPSKLIWACLVDLDIDGGFESDFDGETFILMSDISKFNAAIEEKLKHK